MEEGRPRAVLFVCAFNSVRSPMAAALLRQMAPEGLAVASAGVRKDALDPFAIAAMAETGIDIAAHEPTTIDELEDLEGLDFDLIVTLSPEAHHTALALTHRLAGRGRILADRRSDRDRGQSRSSGSMLIARCGTSWRRASRRGSFRRPEIVGAAPSASCR